VKYKVKRKIKKYPQGIAKPAIMNIFNLIIVGFSCSKIFFGGFKLMISPPNLAYSQISQETDFDF